MKKVKVVINKRNLKGLVNKTSFKTSGMFKPYIFVGVKFETDKNNTAKFYESVQVNQNSWTNYPGYKIWDNNNVGEETLKSDILTGAEDELMYKITDMEREYPEIEFKLIGF